MTEINKEDVQGLLFSGYAKSMKHADYYFLKIDKPAEARGWLESLCSEDRITHGVHRGNKWCLNIAFTHQGLKALGLNQAGLDSFEPAFQDGMNSRRRTRILGDTGLDSPCKWQWGHGEKEAHVLLMLFTADDAHRSERKHFEKARFTEAGLTPVHELGTLVPLKLDEHNFARENFGFADGVSQPRVEGFSRAPEPGIPKVKTGEFLLGYPNEYGRETRVPSTGSTDSTLGKNGTYLVCRQLQQNVPAFWSFIHQAAVEASEPAEYLAAKMVGRWRSGNLIKKGQTEDPMTPPSNDFDFTGDSDGFGCPFGSHIRRSNPRAITLAEDPEDSRKIARRHRLIRRGRSYGPRIKDRTHDDRETRGLMFICLNANIERQFEFVQHTWINSRKFDGLYDEDDPLIGSYGGNDRKFTIPEEPLRRRLSGFSQFVSVKGGAYFFLPSITALRSLASLGEG